MFEITEGVRIGCILSPLLLYLALSEAMKEEKKRAVWYEIGRWKLESIKILKVRYADDMILIGKDKKPLNKNLKV